MSPALDADLAATQHDLHLIHLRWAQTLERRQYEQADRAERRHAQLVARTEWLHRVSHTES